MLACEVLADRLDLGTINESFCLKVALAYGSKFDHLCAFWGVAVDVDISHLACDSGHVVHAGALGHQFGLTQWRHCKERRVRTTCPTASPRSARPTPPSQITLQPRGDLSGTPAIRLWEIEIISTNTAEPHYNTVILFWFGNTIKLLTLLMLEMEYSVSRHGIGCVGQTTSIFIAQLISPTWVKPNPRYDSQCKYICYNL